MEANRNNRLLYAKQLLKKCLDAVDLIWFSDQKVFTVYSPLTKIITVIKVQFFGCNIGNYDFQCKKINN